MSESSLSVGLPELRKAVAFFLGYGRTPANWSAAQLAEITGVVQSGVRRVYYPPAVNAGTLGYEWSWLRPTSTLAVVAGTADYDLPDDFGRLIGAIHYPEAEYSASIAVVSVGRILAMRAQSSLSDAPRYAAVNYKSSDGASGQRQEVMFYPTPSAAWTLSLEYEAYSGALTDANPYPLGGMQLAELYLESCLAVAESRLNDEIGLHAQQFGTLLLDAIARDRKHGARYYGPMGHVESSAEPFRRGWTGSVYPITYNGETL